EEVERSAQVREALRKRGQVEDLVEARILAEIGAPDRLTAHLERGQRIRDLKSAARERLEQLVADLRGVEITHHDEVGVLGELVLEARVDPVREHLQLRLAAGCALAPSGMRRDGDEIEIAGAERAHVRRAPERLRREVLLPLLLSWRVHFGREP